MLGNTLQHFADELSLYFDFDFLDRLSFRRKTYHTYLAEIKKEQAISMPEHISVILKELSPRQLPIYDTISKNWNPHLETIFGILTDPKNPNYSLSINEFIARPTSLPYAALPSDRAIETRYLTLEQYIQSFGCLSERDALIFLDQLCDALSTLQQNHLVHGDISPQNILLTDALPIKGPLQKIPGIHQSISVKLIDFGASRTVQAADHNVTHAMGTLAYVAPDAIDFKNSTDRLDLYCLGCIFFFMLTGQSPKECDAFKSLKNFNKTTRQIFLMCTDDYGIRYQNIKQLRKEVQLSLIYPDKPLFHLLQKMPGFRTGSPSKMLIACEIYTILIPYCFFCLMHDRFSDCLVFVIPYILAFDMFNIENFFPRYQKLCRILPAIRYIIRSIIIYMFLAILGTYW